MRGLTSNQRALLVHLAQRGGKWIYPPRGYAHETWVPNGWTVPRTARVFWELAAKDCVRFDHYYARDGKLKRFEITDLGKAFVNQINRKP